MAAMKKCKSGYYRHNKTKKCRKVVNKKPCGTGRYRSRKTGRCRKIERKVNRKSPSSVVSSVIAPFAFTSSNPCPSNKVRNPKSGICIKKTGELAKKLGLVARCPTGKVYNRDTGRCRMTEAAKKAGKKAGKKTAKKAKKKSVTNDLLGLNAMPLVNYASSKTRSAAASLGSLADLNAFYDGYKPPSYKPKPKKTPSLKASDFSM
jgi:hypothetical protein